MRIKALWAAIAAFFIVSSAHAQLSQSISSIGVSNATIMGGSLPGTYVAALCVIMIPTYPEFYGSLNIVNTTSPPGQTAASFFQVVKTAAGYEIRTTGGIVPAGTYTGMLVATQDAVTNTNHIFEQSVTFTVVAP